MDSTLGKRKEREHDDPTNDTHGSTLFVGNLPFSTTSLELQTLFSDIAPIRSAFVVTDPGTVVSKGVGYVSFAIREDATTAFQNISKDGLTFAGRKIRVQWADQKPADKSESNVIKRESKKCPLPRPQPPRTPSDPLAIRTVVVSGLPKDLDSKVLWKKIRKYEGAEKVDWPIKPDSGHDDVGTANVLFANPAAAADAVSKLHAHVYKGSLLSATLKKRLDNLIKTEEKQIGAVKCGPNRASRLIVRNLPFNATEQDLRAVFLPYGPIHSIHIPSAEGEDGKGDGTASKRSRTKGFAFVWMLSKKDAEKAIEKCNGMVVRAGMAEALVSNKQKRKKQQRREQKANAAASVEQEDSDDEVVDTMRTTERVIAVDWALSKEKWQEAKAQIEEDSSVDGDRDAVMDSSDESGSEQGLEKNNEYDTLEDPLGDMEFEEDDDEYREPDKPQLPTPETGTTVFIRNIPFNATEGDLWTLFVAFGPLRYTRLTMDNATGRSRGTGFACFRNKEDADKVIQQSELLRSETTGVSAPLKKNPFTLPSVLTPDPSSSLAQSLVLHGRTLDVVRAVTRDEAGKLKEDGENARRKADKRNMYLLREGVILPDTPAAATLTSAEVEKRTISFNSRRALLKSNPSLFISKTRLSVRHIPIFVTERMLKRLALHGMRAFEDEVKEGSRVSLTEEELAEDNVQTHPRDNEGGRKRKRLGRKPGVKQAKIVRAAERVDPITGKGRSKGYGFVEMDRHADALRVLRWANNNADVGPLFDEWWKDELKALLKMEKSKQEGQSDARVKRIKDELECGGSRKSKGMLIVEFSIENVQVVHRRNAARETQAKALENEKKGQVEKKLSERVAPESSEKCGDEISPSPEKRRRVSESKGKPGKGDGKPAEVAEAKGKRRGNLGTLVGRKRRERKLKRKS